MTRGSRNATDSANESDAKAPFTTKAKSGHRAVASVSKLRAWLDEAAAARINVITDAIVNALPGELAATYAIFGKVERVPVQQSGDSFDIVSLVRRGHRHRVIVAGVSGPGLVQAANVIASLARRFPGLKRVVLIGIAGGQPNLTFVDKDVRLGDIVISESVVQHDHVKRERGRITEWRGTSIAPPDSELLARARELVARSFLDQTKAVGSAPPWDRYIELAKANLPKLKLKRGRDPMRGKRNYSDRRSGRSVKPKIHIGTIASGNMLLRDALYRDHLNKKLGVICYEMEGAGVAIAAHQFRMTYIIVRGVTDYADGTKADDWHGFAAINAAAAGRWLVENA